VEGDRRQETGRKGGGRCTGDGRRGGGGKWDSQGGRKREATKIGWGLGLKGTGSRRFKPPAPPPPKNNPIKKGIFPFFKCFF